jgi:SAM-dependent methyltransferase
MKTPYYHNYIQAVDHPLPELKETFERETGLLLTYVIETTEAGSTIVDLGCGIGRPLIDLAFSYATREYFGIDNDPNMIRIAKRRRNRGNVRYRINLSTQNFLESNIDSAFSNLTYSTYNSIGHLTDIEKELLIKEKSRITRSEGHVITVTWNRDERTTEFLQKYYPHIGLKIIYSSENGTVTDQGSFDRVHPSRIMDLYKRFNIKPVDVQDLGLWTAVIGRKQ